MTELYISRQPIYDKRLNVIAYELFYQSAVPTGQTTDLSLLSSVVALHIERMVGDRKAFVPVPHNYFSESQPIPLQASLAALGVTADAVADPAACERAIALARQGYQLVLNDVPSVEQTAPLLKFTGMAGIGIAGAPREQIAALVGEMRRRFGHVKLLARRVETHEDYEFCVQNGFDFVQGYFLCKPADSQSRRVDTARIVIMQTLSRILDPRTDFRALADIVSLDVALSYKLLKVINSAYYTTTQRVTSIEQAIRFMGMNALRDWLTLLLIKSIDNKPHELTAIALSRAKLCELLAQALKQPQPEKFFAVGLYSVFDALTDMPMKDVVAQLPLTQEVKDALTAQAGVPGQVLQWALAYERGDWNQLQDATIQPATLRQAYLKAIQWTDESRRKAA